jgi:hypothetical protein
VRRVAAQTISAAFALLGTLSIAQAASAATGAIGTIAPPIDTFTPERTGIGISLARPTSAPRAQIGNTRPLAVTAYVTTQPKAWSLFYIVSRFATRAQASAANGDLRSARAVTVRGSIVAGRPGVVARPLNSGEWMTESTAPTQIHCWVTVGVSYRNLEFVVSASGPAAPLVYKAPARAGLPPGLVSHPSCRVVEGLALGAARHLYSTAAHYATARAVR